MAHYNIVLLTNIEVCMCVCIYHVQVVLCVSLHEHKLALTCGTLFLFKATCL